MTELEELRREMDAADDALLAAFLRRQEIAGRIAACKRREGLPVCQPAREAEVTARLAAKSGDCAGDVRTLYATLFALSRARQEKEPPCAAD